MDKKTVYDWLYKMAIGVGGVGLFLGGLHSQNEKFVFFGAIFLAASAAISLVEGAAAKAAKLGELWKSGEIMRDFKGEISTFVVSVAATAVGVCFLMQSEPNPAIYIPILFGFLLWCSWDMIKRKARKS